MTRNHPSPAGADAGASVLCCRAVGKRYGRQTVLENVDLDLRPGEVLGLLGPNGAGKTTLIKILLGLVTPATGEVSVFGCDLFSRRRDALARVGAVIEAPVFFEYLSAFENLRSLAALTGPVSCDQVLATLAAVGLREVAERPVRTFSYGMKQRLGIAQALLPAARLLILDEPSNGLDPHGIAGIRRLVRELPRRLGLSVLVSSHLLGEIEQMCDRYLILHRGRKIAEGRVDEVRARAATVAVELRTAGGDVPAAVKALPGYAGPAPDAQEGTGVLFHAAPAAVPELVRALVAAGAEVLAVRPCHGTLEELFLASTRDGERDVRIDAF
jgi:ABC-2 type transport system ATP-binding protein